MRKRIGPCLLFMLFLLPWAMPADKTDWEDINFEFNSTVLVDGFPAMLQLADALANHADYRLDIIGHCDQKGTKNYNNNLAIKRAEMVRDYLIQHGAKAEQLAVSGKSFDEPKVADMSPEARFQNRRVVFSLYVMRDGSRQEVKANVPISGILKEIEENPLLKSIDELNKKQDGIITRLDNVEKSIGDLKPPDNTKVNEQLDAINQKLKDIEAKPTPAPVVEKHENPFKDFSMLGMTAGVTQDGDFTGNISGRYFHTFTKTTAIQGEGEFVYYPDRTEFQVDFGLVKRFHDFQMGGFGSFKRVQMDEFAESGTLAQMAFVAEYLFKQGSIGFYFTHAIKRESVVDSVVYSHNRMLETYLNALDQYGVTFQVAVPWDSFIEGNAGWIDRGELSGKPGGVVRWVKPFHSKWSFFCEGGWNETMVTEDTSARFAAGVRYGLWKRPEKKYDSAEPIDIPRVRYDVRTRVVRTGNDAPVANAGSDQMNIPAGVIYLDGSGSYDPENDPITFQWTQILGPAVTLTGANQAHASFTSVPGQVYEFRLKVTDSFGLYSTDDVTISTRENKPPVANAGADMVNVEAGTVQLNGTGSYDPDGETITYAWTQVSGPAVTLTGANTATPTFTAAVDQVYVFQLKVTDPLGAYDTDTISVSTVLNLAPIANAGADLINVEAGLITLNGTASYDPDGDALTYQWTQIGGPTVVLNGANTAVATFIGEVDSNYTFKLQVTDIHGVSSWDEVSVTTLQNRPPIANAGGDQINAAEGTINLDGSGSSDPDGDTITYQWTQVSGPTVALTGATTATPSFTAERDQVYVFRLTITDEHGLTDTDDVQISTHINRPPNANAGADLIDIPAGLITLNGAGSSDPDGDAITFQWVQIAGPAVTLNNANTATPSFTGKRGEVYQFRLTVTDTEGAIGTDDISVTVRANTDPVANAGADLINVLPGLIHLDGTGSYDPDGDTLTFLWTQISGPAVTLTGADTATPSFVGAAGGVYTFRLRVTDPFGAFSTDDVTVSVRVNRLPIANAGADLINVPAGLITLDGSASYDPDGDAITYLWTQISGPAITLIGADTATPHFTADVSTTYTFRLKVTDALGDFAYDDVTVSTVMNRAPVAVTGPDMLNADPGTIALDGSASYDLDGDTLTYLWTQTQGPAVTITNPTSAVASFVGVAHTTYAFRLKVTDEHGAFSYDEIQITVKEEVNLPPVAYAGLDQTLLLPLGVLNLDGLGSYDPEGGTLTYKWTQVEGPDVSISGSDQALAHFTPIAGLATTYAFDLVVTDDHGQSSVDQVRFFIF